MKTMREFLTAVINASISEEVTAFANKEIDKLNAKNDKKKTTMTKDQKINTEIKDKILDFMAEETTYTSPEIAKAMQSEFTEIEISTNKISALMRQLTAENKVNQIEKVKTSKGYVKGYVKKSAENEETTE